MVQYAERVWNITGGTDDERIDLAFNKTRLFFESLGVMTRLSDYGLTADSIEDIVSTLDNHAMTELSETGEVTLEVSRQILEGAM